MRRTARRTRPAATPIVPRTGIIRARVRPAAARHFPRASRGFEMGTSRALLLTICTALGACGSAPVRDATPGNAVAPAAATAATAAAQPTTAPTKPVRGTFGIDLDGRDAAVKPGDDFFRYAGGTWMATQQLPSDRVRWGSFDALGAKSEADVRAILDELAARTDAPEGSVERKVGDYYATFLDTAAIDALGLAPAETGLAAIAAARTHEDVARLMGRPDLQLPSPLELDITIDEKNPDRYLVDVSHGGLGLPEREFYLRQDEQFATIRTKYREHVARVLDLAGQPDPQGAAATILALETEIAKLHWPIAQRRDSEKMYNLRTRAELDRLAPAFPWAALLDAAGVGGEREFVLREQDTFGPLGKLFRGTPVASWRTYLAYHYLRGHAAVLPKAFDDEVFDFYGRTLNGQPEQRARWKRGVQSTNGALGEAVGQVYVQRHFSPDAKAKMVQLVENLREAYGRRIDALPWMTPETKRVAHEKLRTFRPKIGYPDRWRDYSALTVRRGDAFGNTVRAAVFDWQRNVARLGHPTDRDEWFMTPQTVNAYYNPVFNEIVFPAAILQAPFFDPAADPAVNYGAIGGVIGHEMGHGFDDQGAKYDPLGVLRSWWHPADEKAFQVLGDRLAAQYGGYEALPGLKLNGRLTLGENIGDVGGVSVALEAYRLSLGGAPAPVLDGITGEQRFFLGWAQVWRELIRDQALRNRVMTDPHSPARFRVNGVVRNVDAWYEAFGVKPGDALYLPPEQRVHIW
jgi:putative endopeptidase